MVRRTRIAALLTLAMINVFTLAAGARRGPAAPPAAGRPARAHGGGGPARGRGAVLGTGTRAARCPPRTDCGRPWPARCPRRRSAPRYRCWSRTRSPGRCCCPSTAARLITPASTTKLATGLAALAVLGDDARFTTRVVRGAAPGSIVLVGGGDPTLAVNPFPARDYPRPATLASLAAATARTLIAQGRRTVVLGYDTSLYTGPGLAPGWPADTSAGATSPRSSPSRWTRAG